MLSTVVEVSSGDGLLMSSRASRTAAMIDAAISECRRPSRHSPDAALGCQSAPSGDIRSTVCSSSEKMNSWRPPVHGWYYDLLTGRFERYDDGLLRSPPLTTLK
jgi:hypothetical protein